MNTQPKLNIYNKHYYTINVPINAIFVISVITAYHVGKKVSEWKEN